MEFTRSRDTLTCVLTVLLLAISFCAGLTPTARAQQAPEITDVRVEGNIFASEKLIKNVADFSIGASLIGADVQDAVRNLFAKGIFKDVRIEVEEVPRGVILIIVVEEYPKLNSISYSGNKKVKDKELTEMVRITPGGYITEHMVTQAINKIRSEYTTRGYFLADITPDYDYSFDSTRVDLTFRIKERDKIKVEETILTGTQELDTRKMVSKMRNRKRGFLLSSTFKKEEWPLDKEKIIDFAHSRGFIDAYIISDSFSVDTAANMMKIFIEIYEGPQYYFGTVDFEGNSLYTDEQLDRAMTFKPGDVFNEEKYTESLSELYSAYQEEGYLRARIDPVRQTRDTIIDIQFGIVEGLPSEVRMIEIAGNTKTKDKVIRRELRLRPGDTFRRSLLMRSLRDVMALNYFSNVEPNIRDLPSGDIDLIIGIEEKPTGQVSAGAGYSGQDKLVGTFGLGIPNFRGMGQNLSLNFEFGSRRNSVSLSFTEPWMFDTPTLAGFEIYDLNRNWYDDFDEARRGASVRLGRRLTWPDTYTKVFLRYRFEDVKYHDFDDDYLRDNGEFQITPEGDTVYTPFENSLQSFNEEWLRTSSMAFTIERDSRDLPIFATEGSVISYTGEVSGGLLGGRWDFYKHTTNIHKYVPLFWGMSVVGKVRFGYISAHNNDDIPYSERFSPGGVDPDGQIRGYEDAGVTPRSRSGAFLRGIAEAVYNVELQMPLVPGQIYALAFADAGNSWLSREDIKPFSDLFYGAGVGFRLVVPGVGVIGFDFGYAFNELYGEPTGWRPHFQVSQGF